MSRSRLWFYVLAVCFPVKPARRAQIHYSHRQTCRTNSLRDGGMKNASCTRTLSITTEGSSVRATQRPRRASEERVSWARAIRRLRLGFHRPHRRNVYKCRDSKKMKTRGCTLTSDVCYLRVNRRTRQLCSHFPQMLSTNDWSFGR